MGYKNNDRCLDKVALDEPIFVLRARDLSSPAAIKGWLAANLDNLTQEHIDETRECIDTFVRWQAEHADSVRLPD